MRKKLYLPVLVALAMLLFSCGTENVPEKEDEPGKEDEKENVIETDGSYDIYVAGYVNTLVGKVWKNGEVAVEVSISENRVWFHSLAVHNGNIYCLGQTQPKADRNTNSFRAGLWVNGTKQDIGIIEDKCSYGWNIAVSGDDVYTYYDQLYVGYYKSQGAADNYEEYGFKIHKNGNLLYEIREEGVDLWGNSLFVDDSGNTYIAGAKNNAATIWKNETEITLEQPLSGNTTFAYNAWVSGNDVYVGGTEYYKQKSTPVFWKNGSLFDGFDWVPDMNYWVFGGNIYAIENTGSEIIMRKNDTEKVLNLELPDRKGSSFSSSLFYLFEYDSDIFMTAVETKSDGEKNVIVWKNDEIIGSFAVEKLTQVSAIYVAKAE